MPDLPRQRNQDKPHLLVPWHATVLTPRTRPGRAASSAVRAHEDRQGHVTRLIDQLNTARRQGVAARQELPPNQRPTGLALRVEAASGHSLNLAKLDQAGMSLMSARPAQAGAHEEDAIVWLPDTTAARFAGRIEQYTEDTAGGKPRQADLVANIEHLVPATLPDLWAYAAPLPQTEEPTWWELWFDPSLSPVDPIEALREISRIRGWKLAGRAISVGQRVVLAIQATTHDLASLVSTNACPVEVRRPSFAEEIQNLDWAFQRDWVEEATARILPASVGAPTVCVLDSGVYSEHPLLKGSLSDRTWTAFGDGNTGDQVGHGTAMSGLALFGDGLLPLLEGVESITLDHQLESVKILLPRSAETTPRMFSEVTANGISAAEISATPAPRARVFALALTRHSTEIPGHPDENGVDGTATLWSASLDALAAGTTIGILEDRIDLAGVPDPDMARLIAVSVGNVRDLTQRANQGLFTAGQDSAYLDVCDLARIEEPSQAWNVLSVGAHTELTQVPHNPSFAGFRPLASSGDLSPYSRTGVNVGDLFPIKPDIVLEGGNVLVDEGMTQADSHDVVNLATTSHHSHRLLTSFNATSAATAQAARLAALAHARYPDLRPEAVRALLVHEARWTPIMRRDLYTKNGTPKGTALQRARRLRRYGWGVPSEDRVLNSSASAVTMIIQDELVPYQFKSGGDVGLAQLKVHDLPWPKEQLEELGECTVELRVTLSYFVEPNPGRRGMLGRHTYPSHRLRYALKGPRETEANFRHRISQAAARDGAPLDDETAFESDKNWLLGRTARERGSLHCDIWRGNAVELAQCGQLAVFPTASGWWKTHGRADRVGQPAHYALLISLHTPDVETDLYTPVATALAVPIGVPQQLAFEVDISI